MRRSLYRGLVFLLVVTGGFEMPVFLRAERGKTPKSLKLYPVDEADKDPSFKTFRNRLFRAIDERDKVFLLSIVDPKIQFSFGPEGNGIENFKREWKLDQSGSSPLWKELKKVLQLGGTFYTKNADRGDVNFIAPYVFPVPWLPEVDESELAAAIIGKDVNLRDGPSVTAKILVSLSYDIVKLRDEKIQDGGYTWAQIETFTGQTGYVLKKYLRSLIDYRAVFTKKNGRWFMSSFVGGD